MSIRVSRQTMEKLLPLLSTLSEDESDTKTLAEVSQLLQSDPAAPWAYVCYTQMHVLLKMLGEEGRLGSLEADQQEGLDELMQAFQEAARGNRTVEALPFSMHDDEGFEGEVTTSLRQRTQKWAFAGVGVLLGVVATALAATSLLDGFGEQPPVAEPSVNALRVADEIPIAELKQIRRCKWAGEKQHDVGTRFDADTTLELVRGNAKLRFGKGATVLVVSPAKFTILSNNALHLDSGTVAINAEGKVKDFVVASPDGQIVDLGTSFGVHREAGSPTEVEVFQGAVEIRSQDGKQKRGVLRMGNKVQLVREGDTTTIADIPITPDSASNDIDREKDRFTRLLKLLWSDMRDTSSVSHTADSQETSRVIAEFNDAPIDGTLDTFNRAATGQGWVTPWFGTGNVLGDLRYDNPLGEEGNKYMSFRFSKACHRTIAREYGARSNFDPSKPHVISWRWRFEGNLDAFEERYHDRVAFYGNPYFRRLSFYDNTWFIGVVGGASVRKPNYQTNAMEWFVFDGTQGHLFEAKNIKGTGLKLKDNTVYRFTVIVYPAEAKYDVAIQTDEDNYKGKGFVFRNQNSAEKSHVVHFGIRTWNSTLDSGFSLDSLCVQSLESFQLSN